MPDSLSITLKNDLMEIERLSSIVTDWGERQALSPKVVFHVNLVLEEILTNIIAYGYADSDEHYISIGIFLAEGELVIQVADDGRPFNPLEAPEPDLESPLEERPVGGLGLHLVRSLMHEFEYERNEGQNLLVMKKRTTDLTGGRNQVGKGASL